MSKEISTGDVCSAAPGYPPAQTQSSPGRDDNLNSVPRSADLLPQKDVDNFWERLKRHRVAQWTMAYSAGAYMLLHGVEMVSSALAWPHLVVRILTLLLLLGVPVVATLAWFHGDRGRQRVTGSELAILGGILVFGAVVIRFLGHPTSESASTMAATQSLAVAPTAATTTSEVGPSIAVLPFQNRSNVEDETFFVDGIHDDILTQLATVSALKVISRTSVEQFRDTRLAAKAIAELLGVRSLLEGSVQRAGDRIRVNVQLIEAASDAQLWAESYDRQLTADNIFAIQSELATAVTGALKVALTPDETARTNIVPTRNLDAWEAYQLGRHRLAERTSGSLVEAEKHFRKAIELDSNFALAYTDLAQTLVRQIVYSDAPLLATLDRAQAAVDTALQLDPGLSDAWTASGTVAAAREQFDHAEQMYRKAIELSPNNATALKEYGGLLLAQLRIDDGLRSLEQAAALDPLSAIGQITLGNGLELKGRFSDAATRYRKAIEIDPSMPVAYLSLGGLKVFALSDYAGGVPLIQKAVELDPTSPPVTLALASVYRDLDESKGLETIDQAALRWPDSPEVQSALADSDYLRRDDAGAARHAKQALALYPRHSDAIALLRYLDLRAGRYDDAIARYQKAYPELFVRGGASVDPSNASAAIDLARVLQKRGDTEGAKALLDRAIQVIDRIPRLGQFGYRIWDVQIYALRGDKAKALAALREAQQAGWRSNWRWHRDFEPNLDLIRNEPEFKAVFADIERDMARQRAKLAARPKNAPLDLKGSAG